MGIWGNRVQGYGVQDIWVMGKFASRVSCGLVRVVGTVRYMKVIYCGLCCQLVNIPRKHSA